MIGIGARTLWHAKRRLLLSAAGIAVAVTVMFVEQGFFYGIVDSQANIAHLILGDLVVLHRTRTHLNKWNSMDRIRVFQTGAIDGIAEVVPVYKTYMGLRNAETNQVKRIIAYAFPPTMLPLDIGEPAHILPKLKMRRTVLFDRRSRDIYGTIGEGQAVELDERFFQIAGFVDIGPNIINDGTLVMSEGTLLAVEPHRNPVMAVVFLKQGVDIGAVTRNIQERFSDLIVMSPVELAQREIKFTTTSAPVGIIFGIGVLAGFVIGAVVCYQILFNQIGDSIAQYATLKAMGFSRMFLAWILIEQALLLSVAGFAVAVPAVVLLYGFIADKTSLTMVLSWERILTVLSLTITMCLTAGLIAMRRVWRLHPAELY